MADDVLSLRLDVARRAAFEATAGRHGVTVSDLLRVAVETVAGMDADDLARLLACTACGGTGRRFKTTPEPKENP